MLSKKISGTLVGMWLLIPELLKLGAWDILKAWSNKSDFDIEPRIALQLVNENALCVNRVRHKNSFGHQGFQLLNGMGRLVSDEQVHLLLNNHTMKEAKSAMLHLGLQRQLAGHYQGKIIAVDPHRIISSSKRIMAKKKKKTNMPSEKMLQTFFCVSAKTGQPIMATMSSTGLPTTLATLELLNTTHQIIKTPSLLVADKEHFTNRIFKEVSSLNNFDILVPALQNPRIKNIQNSLIYERKKAGFAISECDFNFAGEKNLYRLIAERFGEIEHSYNGFLTTSDMDAETLLCKNYCDRWSVEEFFRFENDMGLNRASTMNLNIRYANLVMAMIAQAALFELRKNLSKNYKTWNAQHLANEILAWNEGDIRVKDDTIIVTYYGASKYLIKDRYKNISSILQSQGINPHIPWLYNYKLDFRFK